MEALEAFFAGQGFPVLVEHGDLASADEKAPLASRTVVDPSLPGGHVATAERPNDKVMA
jgi:hypothetical protein